ncbi:hypothetical protein F4780DRAFT_730626 [Xylariomycetidae sp. FL0641]|nr:hypothetical protein F4780DRAFT_730626 [Xylariomycetidae sp. FL0641]
MLPLGLTSLISPWVAVGVAANNGLRYICFCRLRCHRRALQQSFASTQICLPCLQYAVRLHASPGTYASLQQASAGLAANGLTVFVSMRTQAGGIVCKIRKMKIWYGGGEMRRGNANQARQVGSTEYTR